jgi:hypothetical protein
VAFTLPPTYWLMSVADPPEETSSTPPAETHVDVAEPPDVTVIVPPL